jgi:hypothetical protein
MKIVSCFYEIPSKKPKEFYYEHIQRFFKKLTWQSIVFFTDGKSYEILKQFAGSNVEFILIPFEQIPIFKDFSPEFWKEQLILDPEPYHTWQLGALWACKSFFVREVSQKYLDDWLVWVDAGCVRTDAWNLNDFTRRSIFPEPGVYVQLLKPLPKQEFFQYGGGSYIAGSHILFHKTSINTYIQSYKNTLTKYISNKKCVIDDQYIIASMPNIIPVNYSGYCPDRWFFMFYAI